MLKAHVDNEIWLVQQHHHALISGYLAAHWGDTNGFARPGHFPGTRSPGRVRDEVVLGIAEHDNGWWETEAMPRISDRDGLPVGVGEAAPPSDDNEFAPWATAGSDRWRQGIQRLAGTHPYAALLTNMHAYWLYAINFDDLCPEDREPYRHYVLGTPEIASGLVSDLDAMRSFLVELEAQQEELKQRLARDEAFARAIEPDHLLAHFRLLQLLDSMSLILALNDMDEHQLVHVPRSSWEDRVTIRWKRRESRTIELDPYPFDTPELVVPLPARLVGAGAPPTDEPPLSRLLGTPMRTLDFRLVGKGV